MAIVRESPCKVATSEDQITQWPPRSVFHALMSSPGGRKRWQNRHAHSPSRSPSPTSRHSCQLGLQPPKASAEMQQDYYEAELEDDDEETLQLRLRAIEAKLKLKRIQRARRGDHDEKSEHSIQKRTAAEDNPETKSKCQALELAEVQIPLSPVRGLSENTSKPLSPVRARLGLPSGDANDASLKRARKPVQFSRIAGLSPLEATNKSQSFSERLAETKSKAEQRQARYDRLHRTRQTGFSTAVARPFKNGSSAVEDSGTKKQTSGPSESQEGNQAAVHCLTGSRQVLNEVQSASSIGSCSLSQRTLAKNAAEPHYQNLETISDSGYDAFSGVHLSKRHIAHATVAREMRGKDIYTLPRLLKEVKSPLYETPDCDGDYVVFAILASKSEPYQQNSSHRSTDATKTLESRRNKFMVLHLCDLQWEVDCFIFDTAFDQFWKLTPGRLIAILNPAIMPPKSNSSNGRFSLKICSSEDSVFEIGTARDLGYCTSMKKDGKPCAQWVDKRKTEACEFHINLLVDKSRKHRMEVNSMWRGTGIANEAESRRREAHYGTYSREYGQIYSVERGQGKSAATLFENEDTNDSRSRHSEEASRKRIAAAQKERDLARKLSELGQGVGAAYLRANDGLLSNTVLEENLEAATRRSSTRQKPSAAALGLLADRVVGARLSPSKDRKSRFEGLPQRKSEAIGWAGANRAETRRWAQEGPTQDQKALCAGLVRPRSQDSNAFEAASSSPRKKKARFVLNKGIREPGRESFHEALHHTVDARDDDELDII